MISSSVDDDEDIIPEFPDYDLDENANIEATSVVETTSTSASSVPDNTTDSDKAPSIQNKLTSPTNTVAELIAQTFEKFKNKEITTFSFPSYLTTDDRNQVHKLAEELELFHITTGTRYRKLTVSVNNIDKQAINYRQITARKLRSAAAYEIPNDVHVNDVLT